MANTLTLTIWLILSGLLVGLIIFFVLTSKNKLVKTNQKQKSLLATMLMGAFFVGVVGVSSYFVLLIQFSDDTTGVKFPSTGPDPVTPTLIQCTKSLYATPTAGLITSLLLASTFSLLLP